MTVKKAILISIFLVFIMLLSPFAPIVNAYSELYTLPKGNDVNPENKVIRALNNKYIYATFLPASQSTNIDVFMFSSLGAYISTTTLLHSTIEADIVKTPVKIDDLTLFNIDTTYVGIVISTLYYYTGSYVYAYLALYKFNVNTGIITYIEKYAPVTAHYSDQFCFISNVITVGTNFYVSYTINQSIYVIKLTLTTVTLGAETAITGGYQHKTVMGYDDLGSLYILTSSVNSDTPSMYQFIIATSALAKVGESSMAGIWTDKPAQMNNIKFAGFEYLPYEDYLYLSFNYIYCWTSGVNIYYRTLSFRMIYNETVSLGTLLVQNHRYYDIIPHGYTSAVGKGAGKLYFSLNYDRFCSYYQRIDDGIYKWTKDQIVIPDYYNTAINTMYRDDEEYVQDITTIGEEIPIETLYFGIEQIVREAENNIQFNLYAYVDGGKVYGVSPLSTGYDLMFSLSPDIQPLLLGTSYEFTITAYQGGAPFPNQMIYIYANGVIYIQQQTDIAGKVEFFKTFTVGGYWNLTVKIMIAGSSVYEESRLYTVSFTQGDGGTPEEVAGGNMQQVMNYLIPSIALLFPVGIGIAALHEHPEIGLMVGLTIGGVIAVWSQLVPMYVLIIIVIIDILIIFYGRNSGGSDGL